MKRRNRRAIALVVWAAAVMAGRGAEAEERFAALFSDGSRVAAAAVADWYAVNTQPSLGGRLLLEKGNSFRWLIDRSLAVAAVPKATAHHSYAKHTKRLCSAGS